MGIGMGLAAAESSSAYPPQPLGTGYPHHVPPPPQAIAPPTDCKAGNQTLFYSPHPLLEYRTMAGFSDSLRSQLAAPLNDLGYCLVEVKDYRTILDTARFGDNLLLQTVAGDPAEGSGTILVALLHIRDLAQGKLSEAVSRPLVSIRFGSDEISSLPNILSKKISENMRSQFVADVLIRSHPPGALARTSTGLEGKTPVEWVMPLGSVPVTLEKKGYLTFHRDIDLSAAGVHSYDLQLVKKRFYHSKFIYPALGAGAIALAAFALENHYYSAYQALGAADQQNRPQAFADNFRNAKAYERLGYTALGLAWLSLALSFTF
ncbi:MAG: PEGA domain-containing protein [Fibrobacteria bacterium]